MKKELCASPFEEFGQQRSVVWAAQEEFGISESLMHFSSSPLDGLFCIFAHLDEIISQPCVVQCLERPCQGDRASSQQRAAASGAWIPDHLVAAFPLCLYTTIVEFHLPSFILLFYTSSVRSHLSFLLCLCPWTSALQPQTSEPCKFIYSITCLDSKWPLPLRICWHNPIILPNLTKYHYKLLLEHHMELLVNTAWQVSGTDGRRRFQSLQRQEKGSKKPVIQINLEEQETQIFIWLHEIFGVVKPKWGFDFSCFNMTSLAWSRVLLVLRGYKVKSGNTGQKLWFFSKLVTEVWLNAIRIGIKSRQTIFPGVILHRTDYKCSRVQIPH